MRKNFGVQPWVYPMPVLILAAYGEDGVPNAMNIGWGGVSGNDELSFCVLAEHKTTKNIQFSRAFTVSPADAAHLAACDYLGMETGNKTADKLARAGLHTEKSRFVNAPVIEELPMCLECELRSYDPETGHLVGKIVNVSADPSILDENGKIDAAKLNPLTLDPITYAYRSLGQIAGQAFHDGAQFQK